MATADDLRASFYLADPFIAGVSKEGLAEAARLPALNVAHYQLKCRTLPLENFAGMLRAKTITPDTACVLLFLAGVHPDPFDRMLIAQAQIDGLALVSSEVLFDTFGVQRSR